jgi:cytochrome P450
MTTTAPDDALPAFDLFGPGFAADPHAVLREARAVSWAARSVRGIEVLSYDACERILGDARFVHGAPKMMEFMGEGAMQELSGPGRTLLASEGSEHVALRRAVTPWFTPRRVSQLRESVRALVDGLLDVVEPAGECDFMADIAQRIPGTVFCWMVGAPEEDGEQLAAWSGTLLKAFEANPDDADSIREANAELRAYGQRLMAAKRAAPGDDVTSTLLAAVEGGTITDDDVASLLNEMLAASTDNTAHSAGLAVWLLVTHPDGWQRLVDAPDLIPNAVEECGRFEPRLSSTPVHNPEAFVLDGLEFPADSLSWLNFAAAHRDPDVFDDPDRFDVGRVMPKSQLSFGVGRHYCIGAALARMELQVVLEAVTQRWSSVQLAGDPVIDRIFGGVVHSLPLAFEPLA